MRTYRISCTPPTKEELIPTKVLWCTWHVPSLFKLGCSFHLNSFSRLHGGEITQCSKQTSVILTGPKHKLGNGLPRIQEVSTPLLSLCNAHGLHQLFWDTQAQSSKCVGKRHLLVHPGYPWPEPRNSNFESHKSCKQKCNLLRSLGSYNSAGNWSSQARQCLKANKVSMRTVQPEVKYMAQKVDYHRVVSASDWHAGVQMTLISPNFQ